MREKWPKNCAIGRKLFPRMLKLNYFYISSNIAIEQEKIVYFN